MHDRAQAKLAQGVRWGEVAGPHILPEVPVNLARSEVVMKDLNGQEIAVGKTVCYPYMSGHWIGMRVGKVVAVLEDAVKVEVLRESRKWFDKGSFHEVEWRDKPAHITRVDNVVVLS